LFWLLLPTNKERCMVLALHSPVARILQNPVWHVAGPGSVHHCDLTGGNNEGDFKVLTSAVRY
jgi:hypothetical protein